MNKKEFYQGFKDGIPIGIGYFAVSFALGIAMKRAGLTWLEGFFMSLCNIASAGEYAGIQVIASHGSYFEMIVMTFVTNARYLLMSCSLSQKLDSSVATRHRIGIGYAITDELFGLAYSRKGNLDPSYYYGAMAASIPPWAFGSAFGIVLGNILPVTIVSALSVALYGMFLAIIIPEGKENSFVMFLILLSFLLSFLSSIFLANISNGNRIILLTIGISVFAALIKPIKTDVGKEET